LHIADKLIPTGFTAKNEPGVFPKDRLSIINNQVTSVSREKANCFSAIVTVRQLPFLRLACLLLAETYHTFTHSDILLLIGSCQLQITEKILKRLRESITLPFPFDSNRWRRRGRRNPIPNGGNEARDNARKTALQSDLQKNKRS